jgi:hypothetical protein
MTKSNLKALNAYFRAKSLTYEWTKESSYDSIASLNKKLNKQQYYCCVSVQKCPKRNFCWVKISGK